MKYILMAALLLFIIYVGYRFTEHIMYAGPLHPRGTGTMERLDAILLAALMLLYGGTAFLNLGDTQAPETFHEFKPGDSVELDLGEVVDLDRVLYYTGLNTGSYDFWGSTDGVNYEKLATVEQSYAALFRWEVYDPEEPVTLRYLWIGTGNHLFLGGIAPYDTEGELLQPTVSKGEAEELIDEWEKVPEKRSCLNGTYFDEIYHARTAYEHLVGMWPYEISHPPLGKILMGLGIRMFGMTPFGWRFMGTLAGVAMLPFLYLLSKRMFKNTLGAFAATSLFAFDFMHFVQTRIATIDSYAVLFIVAMYYFMYRFVTEKNLRCLALSGICFGLGAASKWTCIYAGIGLGLIWLLHWVLEWQKTRDFKPLLKNIGFCLVFFVLLPGLIYYMSYYPYGVAKGMSGPGMYLNPDYAKIVWDNQVSMLTYHVGVNATHPYSSWWYQWIFDLRPILYYLDYGIGTKSSIAAFTSPLTAWGGLLAMVGMGYLSLWKKDRRAGFILLGYLAQLVPWMLVTRIQFAYHYFACVVFLCLALGYVVTALSEAGRKREGYALIGVSALLFILFYPVLSGTEVSTAYTANVLQWLPTWPF